MKRKIALVLLAGAVLSTGGGVYAHAKTTPISYVSVDINPSIELGVNAFDEVVSVEAYNEDGEKVLEGTALINTDVDDAVNTVITNAATEGYISEDGTSAIEITTTTDKEDVAVELDESLSEVADEALNDNDIEATVETENVALARRDEARELGITPGKLNLIQKLQALDPTITVEDYKDSSVKEIQKKAKELRKMNKSEDTTNDSNISEETNTNADVNTESNTSADIDAESDTNTDVTVTEEKDENSSKANGQAKKEDSATVSHKEKDTTAKSEKQNNGSNSNLQNNKNNSNSEQQNNNSNNGKGKNN